MDYNFSSSKMLSKPDKHFKEMAEQLIDGKLAVDAWFPTNPSFLPESIDWNIQFTSAASTFQLFLQALRPVSFLCSTFLLNKQKKYIDMATWFIKSWVKYEASDECQGNDYVWDEHSVALRTENILFYYLVSKESNQIIDENYFLSLLKKHIKWLKKHYLENENHGLYEDRALLYVGLSLHNNSLIRFAYHRALKQMDFLFSDEGVSVENSFTYHRVNLNLITEVGSIFSSVGLKEEAKPFLDTALGAEDFMGRAIKPNGINAIFGDSFEDSYLGYDLYHDNNSLKISSSSGTDISNKESSLQKVKIYPNSGYLIGRESWLTDNGTLKFKDSTWTLFKCGYTSITHKQADDNSFSLYSRGEDIFIDSGAYNNNFRDPIRMHVRSATAHNTVIVDDKSFEYLRKDLCKECGIVYSWINEESSVGYVVGKNHLYHGVCSYRHYIYFKDVIVILDEIYSHIKHRYSQLFQVGEKIIPVHLSKDRFIGRIADSGYSISLIQKDSTGICAELYNGCVSGHDFGLASKNFNESHFINTISYSKTGHNCKFVTLLEISPNNKCDANKRHSGNIIIDDNKVMIEDKTINIFETAKLDKGFRLSEFYKVVCDDKIVRVILDANTPTKYKYAWYIVNEKTKERVLDTGYSSDSDLTYDFNSSDDGEYYIRVFYKDLLLKYSQIICHIRKIENSLECRYELNIDPTEA